MIDSQIIKDIQTACVNNGGRLLSEDESSFVAYSIMSIRDLSRQINILPRHLFQSIFDYKEYYGKICYPCDVIELRSLLKNKKIIKSRDIVLLSQQFAKKIIKSYKCLVMLDLDEKYKDRCKYFGGIMIFDSNEMDISNQIHSIVLPSNSPYETISNIVKETIPSLPVYLSYNIPGVDIDKFASNDSLNKYFVNIPSCGLYNEVILAPNEVEAVSEGLDKAWSRHPDQKAYRFKPARYTSEYWLRSGFWSSIVSKQENKNRKVAQSLNQTSNNDLSIPLTEQEREIFSTILDIAKQFNLKTTFRVAGGWVRDRLLGKASDDIDIALDDITGSQFNSYAQKYAQSHNNIGKTYTVDMNVEKSKHLETVAIEINGVKIDFVNLRSETYGADSRIPQMQFGDPKTDALRRDLTINAIFYNINTNKIEDYVNGVADLKNMILRTPLDPTKTFSDDPLRMLRVLRFYSRYPGSKIDPAILDAMKNPQVQNAYETKVAPERAGPEIYKMLIGNQSPAAIRALFETGMDRAVFSVPETKDLLPLTMDQRNSHHQHNLLEHTLQVVENLNRICLENNLPEKERALMLFAAIFHDYGKAVPGIAQEKGEKPGEYSYIGHEDASAVISEAVAKKIGFGKADRDFVNKIVTEHMEPHRPDDRWSKKSIGRWMQKLQIPGQEDRLDMWKYVFYHAEADTMAHGGDQSAEIKRKKDIQQQFNDYINSPKPIKNKPILDGSVLMKLFPDINVKPQKGGINFIKYIQDKLLDEQLSGNISNEEEALNFVNQLKSEVYNNFSSDVKKVSSNWYYQTKIANLGLSSDIDGYSVIPDPVSYTNVKKIIRRNPGGASLYEVGDRVKARKMGLAINQKYGKIVYKDDFIIKVKWDHKDSIDEFDLRDISISMLIDKV